MFSKVAIEANNLTKFYEIYDRPQDRLKQSLWRGRKQYYRSFYALRNATFEVKHGEVLGVVGVNGAGKSTLLRLICGTLTPSSGDIHINGRVSALLELGSGFHPEFTGKENVYMNAAILGLGKKEIDDRYESIVEFAGIGDFVHQPVKTYSSGMRMRLAFAVAINVDPDILVIDEALSVGDGAFSRKSFERIMDLKRSGKTILFCSHSTYQIEKLCSRALWLDHGEIKSIGEPAEVVKDYQAFLDMQMDSQQKSTAVSPAVTESTHVVSERHAMPEARIADVKILADGQSGHELILFSRETDLRVDVEFVSNPEEPAPTVGVAIVAGNGRMISSSSNQNDGVVLKRTADGKGVATIVFPKVPLLKGDYGIDIYLVCGDAVRVLDSVLNVFRIKVRQKDIEQGVVSLPHFWIDGVGDGVPQVSE